MAFKRMFSYAKVDVPNRSGHNVDHRHAFTAKCGTLIPSFSDFLIPGDTVSVAPKFSVQMAPQATDFIGRINLRTELFFVPLRCIWSGWKDFITYASNDPGGPAPEDPNYHAKYLPGALISRTGVASKIYNSPINLQKGLYLDEGQYQSAIQDLYNLYLQAINENNPFLVFDDAGIDSSGSVGPGSLMDYLGFKIADVDSRNPQLLLTTLRALELVIRNYTTIGSALYTNQMSYGSDQRNGDILWISTNGNVGTMYVNPQTSQSAPITQPDTETYIKATFITDRDSSNQVTGYHFNFEIVSDSASTNLYINNILKAVCYHKIWDDWYRDARVMKKLFPNSLGDSPAEQLATIPYITKFGGGFTKKWYTGDQLNFYDGKSVFDLRQRLWQKDYFTTMTQAPQSGDAMSVQVQPSDDGSGVVGEFTIASLRVANAMQIWRERNNLVDARYGDVQYAQYGVYPSDAVTDRAIYLGSTTTEIYNKTVYQQGEYAGNSNNPFNSIGTKYATPIGVGQGSLCNDYKVTEHGYLMALTSIVPEPSYSSGTRRDFHYEQIDDIAFPLLQGVGDQPVLAREIMDTYSGEGDTSVIGYTQRYSEYKFINDHISGLLRDGESLSAFALQRSFSEAPTIGSEFLEIPVDYLDQVSAVGVENSKYGAWIESYWRYTKVSSLSELNSIPTLGRMPDVHQITVEKAGKRL